jgi:hypothetical protein
MEVDHGPSSLRQSLTVVSISEKPEDSSSSPFASTVQVKAIQVQGMQAQAT